MFLVTIVSPRLVILYFDSSRGMVFALAAMEMLPHTGKERAFRGRKVELRFLQRVFEGQGLVGKKQTRISR